MAKTAEYKIVINGLTESISAVESLNKQLTALEQKLNTINATKVSAGTGGGGASRANTALSQEEATQREINKLKQQGAQLDAKIAAAQDHIYQRVDATKQVYKEVIADQKAIAAQERLTADAYSNTMVGMKQKLADLKSVIQTTDLGDGEQIKKLTENANELTNKLKEMEEAYGQFGRNVGNYKDSLKGIEVTIAGVTREFSSSKDAIRTLREELRSLSAAEKGQTQYAKELRREYNKLKSAIDDATKSSKFMDEALDVMQSFTAIQQVSRGFSTFFGIDNSEMEKQIARLVALQNALQGLEKIQKQIDSEEGFGKWLAAGSRQIDEFTMKVFGAQKRMGLFVAETRRASIAANTFAKSMKVVGGIAATGGVMLLSSVVGEIIEAFGRWLNSGLKVGDAAKILTGELNTMANTLDRLKKENASALFNNMSTEAAYLKNNIFYVNNELQKLLAKLGELDKFDKIETSFGIFGNIKKPLADNLPDAKKQFEEQLKLIDDYEKKAEKSIIPLRGLLSDIFGETGKYKRNIKELGDAILNDFLYRVQEASAKANDEILKTGKVSRDTARDIKELNKEANEDFAVNSVLNNVELFSDKGEYYASQIKGVTTALKSLYDTVNSEALDPDRMMQLSIDAMKDGIEKRRAQIELDRKREIDNVNGNLEAVAYINQKYNRQLLEAEKQHNRDMQSAYNDLYALRIEIMKEGLKKTLAQLNEEKRVRIQEIQNDEKLVGERTAAVNALYQKKILEARRDWAHEMIEVYRNMNQEIEQLNRQTMQREVGTAEQSITNKQSSNKSGQWRSNIDINNPNNIQGRRDYYNEILKIDIEAARKQQEIRQENLDKELEYNKKEEQLRHERVVDAKTESLVLADITKIADPSDSDYANIEKKLQKQLSEMRGELVDSYNEGKLDFKDFVHFIEREQEAHTAAMNSLQEEYNTQTEANIQEGLDDQKHLYAQYYNDLLATIRTQQDDVSRIMSQQPIFDKAGWGIVNTKQTKRNYDLSEDAYKNIAEDISRTKAQLKVDLNADKITAEDFFMKNAELDAMKKSVDDALKEVKQKQKNLVGDFIQSIQMYVQALGDGLQQIFEAVWDYQDYILEKQQDELDKLNETLDKKLDEQQDIVERHKDAIDSIEDELATARGSRRQHLIDQLNAEMAAQREAQKQEQKIQKQKEAAERKQEQLDKKRREEEYKRNVTQAFISWHLSVANALATQPFMPVGIAMGALATALGAVQYALVKSQKPYGKGGQLEGGVAVGKRHSEGGIPVLGGRASIEGGEFITNRETTMRNVDVLGYINSKKKKLTLDDFIDFYGGKVKKNITTISPKAKFADGGTIPTLSYNYDLDNRLISAIEDYANRPYYVSVVEVLNKADSVRAVQTLAGMTPSSI